MLNIKVVSWSRGSFLNGAYVGLVFVPIYNTFTRRWGASTAQT